MGQNAETDAEYRRMRTASYAVTGGGLALFWIIVIAIIVSVATTAY